MTWRYLTNSFVQWLLDRGEVKVVPVMHLPPVAGWVSEHATKPPTQYEFKTGIQYDGAVYTRESDGLAWARA